MTTLIVAYRGDGTLIGRCDARCYDAQHEDCHCICGGKNHGKGHAQALERTSLEALDIMANWNAAKDLGVVDVTAEPEWDWNPLLGLMTMTSREDPEQAEIDWLAKLEGAAQ